MSGPTAVGGGGCRGRSRPRESRFRKRLAAGGNWIRTIGPWHERAGFVAEGELRDRTGYQKGCFVCGTDGSNPSPSSRQSVSLPQPLLKVENPLFRAGLGSWLGDRVRRDAPGSRLLANRLQYLCRPIFQYRSAAEVVSENAAPVPTKLGLLRA